MNTSVRRVAFCVLLTFAGYLGFSCSSFGQVSNASVNGSIRDPSGTAVPVAQVILRNLDTNVERQTISNETGEYVFLQVLPGNYTLQVTKQGFETSKIAQFTLTVNQRSVIDVSLNVGAVRQEVNVEATGEAVEAASAGLGGTVTERQVVNLPLNGRNFTQLITLSPGVSPVSVGQNGGGGEAAVPQGSSFIMGAVNGQTNRSTYYLTDGINNADSFFGTYGVAPIIDTLQEFKVNSHPDDAAIGGALGGVVNAVTKSGTNDLHGSAWEFVRNDAFDARNTFLSKVTPYRQNQYGFTVGGPAIVPKLYNGRNKTFFFGGMEWFKYRQPTANFLLVPTAAELGGNLSDVPTQIFNPFTTRPDPAHAGQFIRDPFPGNQIPSNLINPGMVAFAKSVLPSIQNVGLTNKNSIDATPVKDDYEEYTGRIDQTLGEKNYFWFRYTGIEEDKTQSGGLPSAPTAITRPGKNFGASYVRTFSPTTVMQLQFGRLLNESLNNTSLITANPAQLASQIGFANSFVQLANGSTLVPSIGVPGYFSGGMSFNLYPKLEDVYQYKATVSKIIGAHTLSYGGEFDTTNFEAYFGIVSETFSGLQTSNPEVSSQVGSPLASFLLGLPDSAAFRNVHETFRFGGVLGGYVQDSWKVNPAFTVNIGLRYDLTLVNPYGKESTVGQPGGIETGDLDLNHGPVYILQKVPPSCAQRGYAPCLPNGIPSGVVVASDQKILQNTYSNLGPRIGFAYRLSASTALRSGFGVFYDNWAGYAQRAQSNGGNWPDNALIFANALNRPSTTQPLPNPALLYNPIGSNIPAADPFQRVQRYFDPHIQNPYSLQWNFGIQHQFGSNTLLDLTYVGSGSRRLSLADYANVALTPGPGSPALRRPYPSITSTYYETDAGRSDYEALQVQIARRYQSGLQYQIAYTWSKSIDIACSGFFGVEGCSVQDPYHTNLDRSISGFDLTHILSVSILYSLPIGRGKLLSTGNRVADYILGNWQINTLTSARSGTPYNVTFSNDTPNTGNILGYRPNVIGNPSLSNPSRQEWFNTAAFQAPPLYTFGTFGRYGLRTQPFWNIDLSVFRQFPFWESKMIEFRAEAFNAPNTVIYGTPAAAFGVAGFGTVSSTANTARELQLGLKVVF